ncbi:MAG: hypothetical protein NVS1B2_25850 [Vulcanimicrobiaceae bacterium]
MKDPTIGSAAEHVHFVGISGIGMSALARILLQRGIAVSGSSDRRTAMTDRLLAEGARVTIGHAAANVAAATSVVTSTAIDTDNAELIAAQAAGVPIVSLDSPYIHAKAIVADGLRAYVGSANFTTGSLQYNRELGLTRAEMISPAIVSSPRSVSRASTARSPSDTSPA